MSYFNLLKRVTVLVLMLIISGCVGGMEYSHSGLLYHRLGEREAIDKIADDFVNRLMSDSRITANAKVKARFDAVYLPEVKEQIANFICVVTGGPCRYRARTLKDAHAGLKITLGEFNDGMEDLTATLNKLKIPDKEKTELINILTQTKQEIVQGSP